MAIVLGVTERYWSPHVHQRSGSNQGQPGAKAKGSVTPDSSGLPASWSIIFTQGTKRNTTLTIQTQNLPGTGTGDVAQVSSAGITGYGFNSDDAGSWYAQ